LSSNIPGDPIGKRYGHTPWLQPLLQLEGTDVAMPFRLLPDPNGQPL